MKEKNKRKEVIIVGVLLLLIIVIIVGISYAAFQYGKTGTKLNSITTGSITMSYEETDNTISLSGALPTTDKTGTVRLNPGEYFDFSVSSEIVGDVNINYEISAKKEDGNTIDGRYIKLYLTRLTETGEEALMVPETYNEETTSNNYTGRPSNEMSLYTSSMNSSESNNYRLRMYVDESYNPQGDGGGLTFSVRINVYGKAGDKYVPETTETILANNELQEEKENMFNYTNGGTQYDPNDEDDYTTDPNPEYVTNGLYSAEDEDGTSYYFRGTVDNNNVQFGEYESDYYIYQARNNTYFQSFESCMEADSDGLCNQSKLASAGDKMYWKIVRINGDGSLRLIYNGTSTETFYPIENDIANKCVIGITPYNLDINDPDYAGYTYDNSFIKKEVDTWYKNALGNTAYDSKVIGGRFCNDSSGYKPASDYGFSGLDGVNVFASFDRLVQVATNYAKPNAPTLKCPSTSESYGGSYRLKAGLITADELAFAGESFRVVGNSYLNLIAPYWSMTPSSNYSPDESGSYIFIGTRELSFDYTYDANVTIRPVINVKVDNGFASGDGTKENPYVLSVQ